MKTIMILSLLDLATKPSIVIENPCGAFLPNLCNFCKEEIVMELVQRQEDMVYLD